MNRITIYESVLLLFFILIFSCGKSDEYGGPKKTSFEVILPEAGAIQNAGAGNEIWYGGSSNGETRLINFVVKVSEFAVNSMIRVNWADYEPTEGNYRFDKMDKYFDYCARYNQKIDIACFCTSYVGSNTMPDGVLCSYPQYVHQAMQESGQKDIKFTSSYSFAPGKVTWEPNFESDYFYERYNELLKAFAAYLKTTITFRGRQVPREKFVRLIEMRHFGYWGEGAYASTMIPSNSGYLIRFADSFIQNFPDIWICVPTNGMIYIPETYDPIKDYHFYLLTARNNRGLLGTFRDNWGANEGSSYYQKLYHSANKYEKDGKKLYELIRDRWKYAPLVGEPMQVAPSDSYQPYSDLLDQVEYLHPVVIRNCNVSDGSSSTNPTSYSIFNDPQALENFRKMYSIIGFRYLVTSADISRKNGNLGITLNWLNIGLTPTYDSWQVRFFIKNESGEEIWSGFSTIDLRTVFPAEKTPPGEVNEEKATLHTDSYSNVPKGGSLYMEIIDPDGISPNMALSIKGRTKDGDYLLNQ
jgi:hypothetical protein